jgi:thiamine biosynthesis lipoprotein
MTSSSVALGLTVAALAFAGQQQRFEAVEPHMGTLVRLQVYASGEAQAKAAFQAGFARIAQLDDELSDYKPDSAVNRLPGPAGDDLFRVLETAQQLAADTDGAFDITVGPLTRLWRQARRDHRAPDPNAIREALAHCGYRKLHLDRTTRAVTFDDPAMHLDLGGIAKGFAADEALGAIARTGVRSAMVAVSGDLAFSDPPPGQRGWKIDAGGAVRELSNAAVSTSGDAEQHLDAGGRRYSHIIDPTTGMGLTTAITVTVIARRGVEADGLATAISVLGPERGRALTARRSGVSIVVNEAVTQR